MQPHSSHGEQGGSQLVGHAYWSHKRIYCRRRPGGGEQYRLHVIQKTLGLTGKTASGVVGNHFMADGCQDIGGFATLVDHPCQGHRSDGRRRRHRLQGVGENHHEMGNVVATPQLSFTGVKRVSVGLRQQTAGGRYPCGCQPLHAALCACCHDRHLNKTRGIGLHGPYTHSTLT